MDPFNNLPSELRVMILCNLSTRIEVISASHASPALFQQRSQSRVAVLGSFIREELPGDILQDAVSIITFPKDNNFSSDKQHKLVHSHLTQWGQKALPDPVNEYHPELLFSIDALVLRLNLFMGDYINKATSSYLPRAYASLPDWSHASFSEHLKGPYEPNNGVSLQDLHTGERLRLTQAFLQYELMCKLNPLRPSALVKEWRETKDWVWDELGNYEAIETDFNILDIGNPSRPEMLQCVHEYLRTLYGAIIARIATPEGADIKCPASSSPATSQRPGHPQGLVFPDNLQFNPDLYVEDVDTRSFFGIRHSYIDRLAGCGFDLATSLLTSDMPSCSRFLECFYDETTFEHPSRAPFGCRLSRLREYPEATLLLSDCGSGMWRRLMSGFHTSWGDNFLDQAFRRMYRQHAWAFFDDEGLYYEGLYREGYELPTIEEFVKGELRLRAEHGDPTAARERGRGQVKTMQMGMFDSPNRKPLDKGMKHYPTLMGKVDVAFWRRDLVDCPRV
ncbi:hypothetical protein G7Z17_g7383 [Cylindrodendrum hubeiense]|uniref:Uncharacterized protein n=1 Tax=Cylindrodendrum hubeiense TaxID=595255 RepID=A0A9P5H773_9HYPO|nr:hypothetical protein G7Z17_g7383 [Cylindrodendrum hubeiense]